MVVIRGKKRNIRKFQGVNSTSDAIVSTGKGKYKFPKVDEVPANTYFSKIMFANKSVTYNGKPAIDVYYVIRDAYVCQGIMNNTLPQNTEKKLYYIIQRYPVDTSYYKAFVEAMETALDLAPGTKFYLKDIIGITELATLTYQHIKGIGGFKERMPFGEEDFILPKEDENIYDENEKQKQNIEETEIQSSCESPSSVSDDDDFDDFLDDEYDDNEYDW